MSPLAIMFFTVVIAVGLFIRGNEKCKGKSTAEIIAESRRKYDLDV